MRSSCWPWRHQWTDRIREFPALGFKIITKECAKCGADKWPR